MTPTEVRLVLHHGGYCPLPLVGKKPVFDDWPKRLDVTEFEISRWARTSPAAVNTGILTKFIPAFDVDIFSDEEAATAVVNLARADLRGSTAFFWSAPAGGQKGRYRSAPIRRSKKSRSP